MKVEVDVLEEGVVFSDSVNDFGDLDAVYGAAGDVGLNDPALTFREDVGSHSFPIVGKTINGFRALKALTVGFQVVYVPY